mmetsp:Transcript_20329/g.56554  ORF Transcript_20329/g.56554 Transcript_20329/m.56554 type:complete len:293 (-) Transcript_20329:68-946(-)
MGPGQIPSAGGLQDGLVADVAPLAVPTQHKGSIALWRSVPIVFSEQKGHRVKERREARNGVDHVGSQDSVKGPAAFHLVDIVPDELLNSNGFDAAVALAVLVAIGLPIVVRTVGLEVGPHSLEGDGVGVRQQNSRGPQVVGDHPAQSQTGAQFQDGFFYHQRLALGNEVLGEPRGGLPEGDARGLGGLVRVEPKALELEVHRCAVGEGHVEREGVLGGVVAKQIESGRVLVIVVVVRIGIRIVVFDFFYPDRSVQGFDLVTVPATGLLDPFLLFAAHRFGFSSDLVLQRSRY